MKYMLIALGFILSITSWQASAAPMDLGLINDTATFENNHLKGAFSDTYTFTVPNNIGASAFVGNTFKIASQKIADFKATLDGVSFGSAVLIGKSQFLTKEFDSLATAITHTLVISGTALKLTGYAGHIDIAMPTPIPAVVWLFGSALASLACVRRRKV